MQWLVAAAGEYIGKHAALIALHFKRASDHPQAMPKLQRGAQATLAGAAPATAPEGADLARDVCCWRMPRRSQSAMGQPASLERMLKGQVKEHAGLTGRRPYADRH